MKISVVIPNYNGERLLKINLPQVLNCTHISEVIVVDDASTDESVKEVQNSSRLNRDKIQNEQLKLKIITNEKNLGFASTVNRGVKEASGELIVLLNTDVCPEPKFLETVISYFNNPKVFAVGFLQKCKEGSQIILRGRGIGRFQRGFLIHSRGATSDKDTSDGGRVPSSEVEDFRKTLWVSGGAGIFRKKIWESLGGLNPLYNPFYWEDIDLSYRALKAGYDLIFESKSIVNHYQQEGAIKSIYSPFYIKTIAYRNQILFIWLNITDFSYLIQHLVFLPFHFIKSLIIGDWAFISGLFLAIQISPLVFVKRKGNIKLNQITDVQILKNFLD